MLDSATILRGGRTKTDDLASPDGAEKLWASLPRDNPMEMQRLLCDAIASGASWTAPDLGRFRAIRVLDQRASRLQNGTLAELASLGAQSPSLERKLWHTALETSRSFANEFDRYLRAIRGGMPGNGWGERAAEILVRLFFHRDIELVLTLLQYERWPRGRLKSLHEAYRFALDCGCAQRAVAIGARGDDPASSVTPERALIRVLMLQLLDGGQFRPDEIVRARRAIAHWSSAAGLQRRHAMVPVDNSPSGFFVDLAGSAGLVRTGAPDSGELFWLDTAPIADAIAADLTRIEGDTAKAHVDKALQRNLLLRLGRLYAPQYQTIARRGERVPVALTSVEATVGRLQTIFRMLRGDARRAVAAAAASTSYAEEITITDLSRERSSVRPETAAYDEGVDPTTWHVRDQSASGVRLRGRKPDTRRLLPGMLAAFREDATAPWTVGFVRRVLRIMGNNVEIGVEQIGRHPQRVILQDATPGSARTEDEARVDRFIALYLSESAHGRGSKQKTLLLPASEYQSGRVLTMLSTTREMTIRCGEALEQQPDFVWTTFEPTQAISKASES